MLRKVRSWKAMEKEFGLSSYGSIACEDSFVDEMKHLCGREINIVRGEYETWCIGEDMLEPLLTIEEQEMSNELEILNIFSEIDVLGHLMDRMDRCLDSIEQAGCVDGAPSDSLENCLNSMIKEWEEN